MDPSLRDTLREEMKGRKFNVDTRAWTKAKRMSKRKNYELSRDWFGYSPLGDSLSPQIFTCMGHRDTNLEMVPSLALLQGKPWSTCLEPCERCI
jgi:hypothetical protein